MLSKQASKREKLALCKVTEYSKILREKWMVPLCLCYYITSKSQIFYTHDSLKMEFRWASQSFQLNYEFSSNLNYF